MKVRFLDGAAAVDALRERGLRLAMERAEVEEVWLFGSLARGDYSARSDADVLLVLKDDPRPFLERSDYLQYFLGAPLPVDVFPYTRAEYQRMQGQANSPPARCAREGQRLA